MIEDTLASWWPTQLVVSKCVRDMCTSAVF